MAARRVKIFFDGGCRPNPGRMETAIVARGQIHITDDLGQGTSEEAEWLALIQAARIAQQIAGDTPDVHDFLLLGDALHVVRQANGAMPVRARAAAYLQAFRAVAADGAVPRVRHIPRTQNLAGIVLAGLHPR